MKRIELKKVNTASFFLLPAIGFVRINDWYEGKYYYKFCIGWFKLHFSVVIFTKPIE